MNVLLATIPSDSHTWNLVYVHLFLEELNHKVINLGPCVPIDLLVESAVKFQPDVIVISSINGHANIEGVDIARAIAANNLLNNVPLIIGGKLGTQGDFHANDTKKLVNAGFNGVFSGENAINNFTLLMQKISDTLVVNLEAVA